MFKRVPSARTKDDSDMQPIAPTPSPTIGNTLVTGSYYASPLKLKDKTLRLFKLMVA